MASAGAIRYVAASKKNPFGAVYLQCHVKPGASKSREGVTALTDDAIEICVAAQAREGEANKAVVKVLSDALNVPKSDLQITQGLKSRDKVLSLGGSLLKDSQEDEFMSRIVALLDKASKDS